MRLATLNDGTPDGRLVVVSDDGLAYRAVEGWVSLLEAMTRWEDAEPALREAAEANVKGKAVTPWLLSRMLDITGGRSLEANIALVENNARLATQIARAMAGD